MRRIQGVRVSHAAIFVGALIAGLALPAGVAAQMEDLNSVSGAKEADMVLIPGGESMVGVAGQGDASPPHKVSLAPFLIDRYEVTNAQYQKFCEETDRSLPFYWEIDRFKSGPGFPNHPVVGISAASAKAFAKWRGARLPSEAEWEYAARGGLEGKKYSSGDTHDSTLYAKEEMLPVGSFPANGYGVFDMTGNVVEWVNDRYDKDYYHNSPTTNPTGPYVGYFQVIRGGGWHTGPFCSRVDFRNTVKSNWLDINIGFRCAKYAGESAALKMETVIAEDGIAKAVAAYWEMREAEPGVYYFDEMEINEVGYRLLGAEKITEAFEVLRLNIEAYPDSPNAWDSIAEVHMKKGNKAQAIRDYRKCLELHPGRGTAKKGLQELGVE